MRSVFYFLILCFAALEASPELVYLCLGADPSREVSVQWIGGGDELHLEEEAFPPVKYPIHGSNKVLNRVTLRHLEPDTEYRVMIDGSSYRFKTLPEELEEKEIRFVVGGDVYGHYDRFRKMNATVAKLSPDFIVLGGDIAYAFGYKTVFKKSNYQWERWETFLKGWSEQMIDREGRLIPMVVVVGNHDIRGKYRDLLSGKVGPILFYTLFPFEEDFIPYRKITIASSLALFALDSGHTHGITGEQTRWLEETLKESQGQPFKMAIYHIPAYPSHTSYTKKDATLIRKHWSPLFERYGVQATFENHNHTYKRTKSINGVMYLGDGSWGVRPRTVKSSKQRTFLEKSASVNAVFLVSLQKSACKVFAIDNEGRMIDEIPLIRPHTRLLQD